MYTAEDIQKYFSGKLSFPEMNAMEKAALDDPFLAEAMEGFEAMKHEPWEEQLNAARLKIQEGDSEAKIVPLYKSKNNWWKAAAAILLLGGGAALTYTLTTKKATENNPDTIAKVDQPVVIDTTTKQTVTQTSPADTTVVVTPPPVVTQNTIARAKVPVKVVTKDNDVAKLDTNFIYKPGENIAKLETPKNETPLNYYSTDKNNIAANGAVTTAPVSVSNNAVTNNSNVASETVALNRQQTKEQTDDVKKKAVNSNFAQQLNHSFAAQVVSTDNAPLPFANINIKTENFGTYADVKGNFRLVSTDSLVTVEVRSVGYLPRTFTLNSNAPQNKIVLTEDATAFAEKTIIKDRGTGKASRRATLLKDSIVNVEPADGWDNYNTYVSNNIDIPEEILQRDLHGEMEISFTIQPNGAITNIKVDKSLCDNCDEAAARKLIEQGPQWKLKKGKAGKARIKVQF